MENLLLYGLIGIAVAVALAFLNKAASNQTTLNEFGWYELRMNRLYQIVGVLVGIMGLSFLYLLIGERDSAAFITIVILSLGFAYLGLYCWLWYRNHRVKFNEETIKASNAFGKSNSIKWSEISKISYNSFSGLISVMDQQGAAVKIHQHLVGLNTFVEFMEQRTKWNAKDLKLPPTKPKQHFQ